MLSFLTSPILTGLFLAMHYTAHVHLAFLSVEHLMRDVHFGWLIRFSHANGASLLFLLLYSHIARGIFPILLLDFKSELLVLSFLAWSWLLLFLVMSCHEDKCPSEGLPSSLACSLHSLSLVILSYNGFEVDFLSITLPWIALHYFLPFGLAVIVFLQMFYLHVVDFFIKDMGSVSITPIRRDLMWLVKWQTHPT